MSATSRRVALVLAAALPLAASTARAQLAATATAADFSRAAAPLAPATIAMPAAEAGVGSRVGTSTVLHGTGGALIGGFFGYLLSQVIVSQWDEGNGAKPNRTPYIAAGAVLGGATGVVVDLWGRPRRSAGPDVPVVAVSDRTNSMDREEIVAAGATNLYQLVRSRRNQWLVPRGNNSFREGATSRHVGSGAGSIQVIEGGDYVTVYVDGIKLGGVEKLADLLPINTERLEYLDPGQATLRFGGGNSHGTILVISRRPADPATGTP